MRASSSEIALTFASVALAASIAGSATRDVFVGPPTPDFEVVSIQLATGPEQNHGPVRSIFAPEETVVAWLGTRGTARAWLTVRWVHESGEIVQETTRAVAGPGVMPFRLAGRAGRPAGTYRVEVYVDDLPSISRDFEVLPG